MVEIAGWMNQFLQVLEETFGSRVWFVGLQGSHARGEATEASDIDTVVILDELSASDIQTYNAMLDALPHRDLICGFLSGKKELLKDIFINVREASLWRIIPFTAITILYTARKISIWRLQIPATVLLQILG